MPRYYEDYDVPTATAAQRAQQIEFAKKAAKPTVGLGASLAELQRSIDASKATSAAQTQVLAEAQMDVGAAAEAQVQARADAEKIAAETGSKIDTKTGMIIPKTTPVTGSSGGDNKAGGGGIQFVEYEYSKDFKKRKAKYFNSATGAFSYGEWEDVPMSKEDFDAQQAKKIAEEAALNQKRDAFALIEATMRSYGFTESELKELIDYIQAGLLNPSLGANQMVLQLRQLPSYKARFAGNEERRARGLNTLDEADYLRQENAYAETFRQYGLQRFVTRGQFANLIGNDISNTELNKRVMLGVNRLQNADPAVLSQLRKYYNINDADILSYVLNPKEVLPELEAKTTQAEIGATAAQFGLNADLARAKGLQQYGVNLQEARTGYEKIASILPRTTTLADIYKQAGIDYTQTTAEEEEFKGLASAKRARERLKELEIGSFSGQSGLARTGLTTNTGGTF